MIASLHPMNRRHSGIRQRCAVPGWLAVLCCGLLVQTLGAFQFHQTSDPVGIVVHTAELAADSAATTVTAPAISGALRFTHWTLNGVRANTPVGDAANPVNFTINSPVEAVAHYLPAAQDSDADGLPDWWEIHYFGNLSQGPTDDPDSDGLDNLAEYLAGSNPLLANQSEGWSVGGLSRSRSLPLYLVQDSATQIRLRETSVPPGVVNQVRIVPKGVPVTLTNPPTPYAGWRFTGWLHNGVRFDAPTAIQPITIVPTEDMEMVARYVQESLDSDGDQVPDWMEWLLYNSLAYNWTSDTDGDGFTWADENARGFSPIAADQLVGGGVSRSRSMTTYAQTSGRIPFRLTSDPATILEQTDYYTPGTSVASPDLAGHVFAGYKFAWWDLNGVRQSDPSGAALGTFTTTLLAPAVATAHYIAVGLDSDGDSILDWFEWYYYGNLSQNASSDSEGDGFNFGQELARGQSPDSFDELLTGGVSRARSMMLSASASPRYTFRQVSDPPTIIGQTDFYAPGTPVTSLNLAGNTFAGYKFVWWDLDGVRQADPSGAALGVFSFTLNHDSVATAHYVDPNLDSDGDGIPDWIEWYYYGNLSQNASSDSDSDGFTFAQELARGQSPVAQDTLITGGISRSRGATLAAQISEDLILPGIGAITVTAVSSSSAHISVIVNPANSATTAYFQYGITLGYGHQAPADNTLNGVSTQAMVCTLHGLIPGTLYHCRIVATNAIGTVHSEDFTFHTLGVAPIGYDLWSLDHGVGGPLEDADNDGVANLLEYAFGLDPNVYDANLLPAPELIGDRFRLRCTEPAAGVSGIIYGAEWSTDLVLWNSIADDGVAPNHVFWTPPGAAVDGRLFVRWSISQAP